MIAQGTPDWHAQRLGKATASRIADIVAKTKGGGGWGASRANYAADLICERLTGVRAEGYTNAAMAFGIENEPLARATYEFRYDVTVGLAGFVDHPTIKMSGASPDGYVGESGLIEIKVPNTATHIQTLLTSAIPEKHRLQMAWQMSCTGRKWCDYCSCDPRLPEEMRLFVQRVPRDDILIAALEKEVEVFQSEIDDTIKRLKRTYAEAA